MSCPATSTLSNATFIDVCILANAQNNPPVLAAMQTCCGNTIQTIDDGCYTYCNVTTPQDAFGWQFCISDNLDPNLWADLDFHCPSFDNIFDFAVSVTVSGTVTSTFANNVPTGLLTSTTWSPTVTATITFSSSGKPLTTFTFDPKATDRFDIPPLGAGFQLNHPEGSGARPVALSTGFLTESVVTPTGDVGGSVTATGVANATTAVTAAIASTSAGLKTSGAEAAIRVSVKKLGVGMLGVLLFGIFA